MVGLFSKKITHIPPSMFQIITKRSLSLREAGKWGWAPEGLAAGV
jgi:hypothetical protein